MSQERLQYTIPANPNGAPAVSVDATLTLSDTQNSDGSYDVTGITGTRTVGSTQETITGLDPGVDSGDEEFWTDPTRNADTDTYVDHGGLTYSATGSPDSAGETNPNDVNFYGSSDGYGEDGANDYAATVTATPVTCFTTGTTIRTGRGDIAVEHLAVGDLAVTTSGAHRPIRWIGRRSLDCRNHPRPHQAMPVRIAAGAFGPGRPVRDLCVSPGHAICVDLADEVLIPAGELVNGATITQENVDTITYWHVALDSHDVILAEGLPCESFLDMGNRSFFADADVVALHGQPDAPVSTQTGFCRPWHATGTVVAAAQAQLRARAVELGWTLEENTFGDLHLIVDGEVVRPDLDGLSARFVLTVDAREVVLVSTAIRPASIKESGDTRVLGAFLKGLSIDDGLTGRREIELDHPLLGRGFHQLERVGTRAHRWTDGRALLPAALWKECRGTFFLRIDLASSALPHWLSPRGIGSSLLPGEAAA